MSIWTRPLNKIQTKRCPFPKGHPLEGHRYLLEIRWDNELGEHTAYASLLEEIPGNEVHRGPLYLKYLGMDIDDRQMLYDEDNGVYLRSIGSDASYKDHYYQQIILPRDTDTLLRPFYILLKRNRTYVPSDKVSWVLIEYFMDMLKGTEAFKILREFYKNERYIPYNERKAQWNRQRRNRQ